jgi:serine/threonine protein kinase
VWAGKYAVFDELASGGMASVYLACRLLPGESSRVVAVKKMFESFAKRPELVTMFLDEAHIAARIRHPNVVTTWEFLRVPGSLAIVMEFVLGSSLVDLQEIMAARDVVAPVAVTAAIVHGALEGLHAAHETKDEHDHGFGLVHRDVSPHNILVGKDGLARVIDFGIAKAAGRLQVTDVGVMKGKLAYMAPEQIRVEAVDRRVDVYSAGVVLWEALTGKGLFQGPGELEQFALRGAGTITVQPPSAVNPALSPKLDAVVLCALEVLPANRFASAREMAVALEAAVNLASQTEVAAWVTGLAGSRLRELEAKRNEVEASYASGELAGLSRASMPDIAARASSPEFIVPDLVPQPRARKPSVTSEGTPQREAPAPSRRPPLAPPPSSFDDPFDASAPSDLRLDIVMPPMSRPRPSSSSLDVVNRLSSSQDSSRRPMRARRSRGRGALFFLVVLGGAGSAAWRFGPDLARASIVDGATKRGLAVTIDRIDPRSGGFTLTGVTVSLANVKDVTLTAPEVDLTLDWQGRLQKVFIPGYDLTLHGTATDLATRFAAWRKEPHAAVACEAKAGHLSWTDAIVPGVHVEGIDVSLSVGDAGEGAVHVEVPSLTVGVSRGSLGPWRAVLDSTAEETKLAVAFDRAKVDGPPNVVRPTLGSVLSITIPRTKPSAVGVPSDFVASDLDLALESDVLPAGEPLTAHAKLALFGVPNPTPRAAGSTDIVVEGAVSGDTSGMLRVESGTLTIGKVKTPLTGSLVFAHDGLRVEVEHPVGKTAPPPPFTFDTREWTAPPAATKPPVAAPVATPAPTFPRRRR